MSKLEIKYVFSNICDRLKLKTLNDYEYLKRLKIQ